MLSARSSKQKIACWSCCRAGGFQSYVLLQAQSESHLRAMWVNLNSSGFFHFSFRESELLFISYLKTQYEALKFSSDIWTDFAGDSDETWTCQMPQQSFEKQFLAYNQTLLWQTAGLPKWQSALRECSTAQDGNVLSSNCEKCLNLPKRSELTPGRTVLHICWEAGNYVLVSIVFFSLCFSFLFWFWRKVISFHFCFWGWLNQTGED